MKNSIRKTAAGVLCLAMLAGNAGITSFEQITYEHIEKYLLQYKNNSIKTRGCMVNYLKKLFGYLYGSGITDDDLREYLPKLRIPRSSGIPHTWTKEELTALLNAIDREDPAGKRNYAVFLLTIHTGLRALRHAFPQKHTGKEYAHFGCCTGYNISDAGA